MEGMRLTRSLRPALTALLVLWLLSLTLPASAHTDLDSTTPQDGAVVTEDVSEVMLTFTLPVATLGEGITVTGPSGPVDVDVTASQEDAVFTATAAEPLEAGDYQVEWTVAATDGHPLTGEFGFAVAQTDADSANETQPGAATEASPSQDDDAQSGTAPDDAQSGTAPDDNQETSGGDGANTEDGLSTLEARIGAGIALTGLMLAAGGLTFSAMVLRGGQDVPAVLRIVRWAGVAVVVGAGIRLVARSAVITQGDWAAAITPTGIGDALAGITFWVFVLQFVGGLLIAVGAWGSAMTSVLAWLGCLAAGTAHVLGGHSSTAEPRWLVLVADVSHLSAGAVWFGGVVFLAVVLGRRRRKGRDLDAALLGARFSVIAGVSVAVVGAAGVALTVAILDEPSQLWGSTWGLLLIAKVAVVVVVAGFGAHHHFNVVPQLASGDSLRAEAAAQELRRSTVVEAGLLVDVVLLTAWLVGASLNG